MTVHVDVARARVLGELLRASDRWPDASVASGWLLRAARERGIEITPAQAYLMICRRRRRGGAP
ncbi:MAG TPA: hypothetical protein VIL25_02125 [Vicinamibacterales bacterium]